MEDKVVLLEVEKGAGMGIKTLLNFSSQYHMYSDRDSLHRFAMISQGKSAKTYPGHSIQGECVIEGDV